MDDAPKETVKPTDYYSWLLRFWREGGATDWRASLHDPHDGERLGFASANELFAYLERQIGMASGPDRGHSGGQKSSVGTTPQERRLR